MHGEILGSNHDNSIVYIDRPETLVYLKDNIGQVIVGIPAATLKRIDRNFKHRVSDKK